MSKKNETYTWCTFERTSNNRPDVTQGTHGYIPSCAAKVGNRIQLTELSEPDRFWTVKTVTEQTVTKEFVREAEKQHKNHRKATDV
jgi:hypothetical protein